MAGERFGPYELRSLLGRGGMGEVYRAIDTRKSRGVVALKRLPAGLAADTDFQRRFLREAELAARLRDPHVIPIHDYGEIDGQPYLDMRLVDGIDLATHLERHGPLPPARAVAILTQVADALDAAHGEGLVHRDVKPQNILLNRPSGAGDPDRVDRDFVYLIDFGIAANLLSARRSSAMVSGTAAYMAPERFTAGGDHRVDVYALGCVLHELLTGRTPFVGDFMQLLNAHANTAPPAPSALVPALPRELDAVVATAMAKEPAQRQPDAGSLAAAARRALTTAPPNSPLPASRPGPRPTAGRPAGVKPPQASIPTDVARAHPSPRASPAVSPPDLPGAPPTARRRQRLALAVAGVAVVLAAILVAVLVNSGPPGPPVIDTVAVGDAPRGVALTPDGRRAYTTNLRDDSVSVIDTSSNTATATIDVGSGPAEVAITPDGRRAYTTNTKDNSVSVVQIG